MITRIELAQKPQFHDAAADALLAGARDLGISGLTAVRSFRVYYFLGELTAADQERIATRLLADTVTEDYAINALLQRSSGALFWSVEVTYNRGVTDMVAETTRKGALDLGLHTVEAVKTARRYELAGPLTEAEKTLIAQKLLMNKVVEHLCLPGERLFFPNADAPFELIHVPLLQADAEQLLAISRERDLFLNLAEMQTIQAHFRGLQREPTDIELEMIAQTWSEHCSHKTLTGLVEFDGRVIDNPLKETIFRVTRELDLPWCISVFKDNAGVIAFDDEFNICFKVETHNHPSAMEPYGGANTGIGGVIRDPMGTGLGAKPIINTDVFCFGPVDWPHERLPKGVLHPKRVMQGVVAGVRDYGNRMGIPTSNGALYFDERYLGNPLVFCGNVGLIPRDKCEKTVVPGDYIVVVGGRTGRDGIHGATASSGELHSESEGTWSGAVQIGNPIVEKKLVDTLLQARDRGLYRAITDCGAGGLSSAVGELAKSTGAEIDLEFVPLKYHGLTYMEIWISEAQERMVIFVAPEHLEEALVLFAAEDVEATVIGRTTSDQRIRLRYHATVVGELEMAFLHDGQPRIVRKAAWKNPQHTEPDFPQPAELGTILHRLLAAPNVCSKEWVIRQYDHEVQGGSVLKPLVGATNDGPGDACITRPRLESPRAVVLANGLNPRYGLLDPYWMAASAIDEALRNIIAVGGHLERTALLDNFCWGNTDKADRLGGLLRAAQACYDMARVLGTPFISGKDSLNNEYKTEDGKSIAIPPTLLISAISVMDDCRGAVSMDLKRAGNALYLLGATGRELGGSHYYDLMGQKGGAVPQVDPARARALFTALAAAIAGGLVRACHDCSEGGLGVALAEMAFAGGLGAMVTLREIPRRRGLERSDWALFSESNSRFVVEVAPEHEAAFVRALAGLPCARLGEAAAAPRLQIRGLGDEPLVDESIDQLKHSWQETLRW
ncbi:MAG TPA: phosphoribosylformylglycinamidine synthase subunit PurL [bacterium]|nr:phosphoribosylformylglycinamidine synthase subunit PurL [bacterium]HPR87369.1 phosphoribosylformylglycinamidine synthase subunit PurL [bacterium]